MEEIKKTLDISGFCTFIKNKVIETPIMSHDGGRFYGNIKIRFQDGVISEIERFETLK